MARNIIGTISCAHCNKPIEIATEDLEWEHLKDCEECEDNPSLHDYAIWQDIECPHCGKINKIIFTAKGTAGHNLDSSTFKLIALP